MDLLFELPAPLMIGIIIAVEVGVIALVLFVLQKLGVNITGGLPKTAWLQGVKNGFSTLLIMGTVTGAIAIIPIFGFGQSIKNGFTISFGAMWVVLFFWFVFTWAFQGQKAGLMLLDITSFPNRSLILVIGIVATISGFFGSWDFVWEDTIYSRYISIGIGLFVGTCFVIIGFSHIQIHKNGIVVYGGLIKWNKIESFEWVDGNGKVYTLKFRVKGKMPAFLRNGAIPIPIEKKEKLESLLAQYLPEIVLMQNRA